jgi:hypothetical protein
MFVFFGMFGSVSVIRDLVWEPRSLDRRSSYLQFNLTRVKTSSLEYRDFSIEVPFFAHIELSIS